MARAGLVERFSLSEKQAKAILEMRLQRLTSLEVNKIIHEMPEVDEYFVAPSGGDESLPIGGVLFIVGWALVFYRTLTANL